MHKTPRIHKPGCASSMQHFMCVHVRINSIHIYISMCTCTQIKIQIHIQIQHISSEPAGVPAQRGMHTHTHTHTHSAQSRYLDDSPARHRCTQSFQPCRSRRCPRDVVAYGNRLRVHLRHSHKCDRCVWHFLPQLPLGEILNSQSPSTFFYMTSL